MNMLHVHAAVAITQTRSTPVLLTVPCTVIALPETARSPWNVVALSAGFEVFISANSDLLVAGFSPALSIHYTRRRLAAFFLNSSDSTFISIEHDPRFSSVRAIYCFQFFTNSIWLTIRWNRSSVLPRGLPSLFPSHAGWACGPCETE